MLCSGCGSDKVRRGSTLLRHLARTLRGSGRRVCRACGRKWHEDAPPRPHWSRSKLLPLCVGLFAGLIAAALAGVSLNPVDWAKSLVVSAYVSEHGKGATKALWNDLKGAYGSKGEAISDFRSH